MSDVIISSNSNTMPDLCNSNTTMLDAIPIQLDPSTTRMCGHWREEMYVRTMERGEDNVLAMVLIENELTLLLMIEQPERKLTTTIAMTIAKQRSHTVLGVPVERGTAITIIKWAMALGHQQGTRQYRTQGKIQ